MSVRTTPMEDVHLSVPSRFRFSGGELPDDRAKWEARMRSWRNSRFWLPLWGAKPGEAGCMVPAALLATTG